MFLDPQYILREVSIWILCPFLTWVVFLPGVQSCEFFIYLEIKPMSKVSLANIFSDMVGAHIILLMFCLAMQKFFILIKSHFFIFSVWPLQDISVKVLLHGISDIFLPIFTSRTFMMSGLIFQSFIHLELIFVYGVNWWSSFIFLHVAVQISQNCLLKSLFLLHFMLLALCQILIGHGDSGLILGSSTLFWSMCVSGLMPVLDCFDYCGPVIYFDVRYGDPFFVILFQNCYRYSGSFMVPYKVLKCLFYICEICLWYFKSDCVESINCFG